jgi:hypothetical protein
VLVLATITEALLFSSEPPKATDLRSRFNFNEWYEDNDVGIPLLSEHAILEQASAISLPDESLAELVHFSEPVTPMEIWERNDFSSAPLEVTHGIEAAQLHEPNVTTQF